MIRLRDTIPGFRPVDQDHVVLVGTRDLEDYQQERLAASRPTVVGRTVDPGELGGALDDVRQHVERVYCTFNRFEVSAAALT